MPYPTIPSKPDLAARWDSWGDVLDTVVRKIATDLPALQSTVAALQSAAASGSTALPAGLAGRNVQKPDGTWTLTRAQVDVLHAGGASVEWVTDGTANRLPAPADGLADGDLVNGEKPGTTALTIPASAYPVGNDQAGTGSDAVTLTRVDGVTWVVDGVEYPSSGFSSSTAVVPFGKGTTTTVAAKPSSGMYTITGTSSWTITFTGGNRTVLYSDTFNRADATYTAGKGNFPTNAGLGGTAFGAEVVGTGVSVASNRLKLSGANVGVSMDYSNVTSAAIQVAVPVLPVNGTLKVCPARASGGTAYLEATVATDGAVWVNWLEPGGSLQVENAGLYVDAGGTVYVEKIAKAWKITATKASGTSSDYKRAFGTDFTPVRGYVQNANDTGGVVSTLDDLILYKL